MIGQALTNLGYTGSAIHYEDGTIEYSDPSSVPTKAALDAEVKRLTANKLVQDQIVTLEKSIDSSRMRREVFEGMRKKLAGLSPTAAEAWSIAKVQDVDNQISVLRAKLK